MIGALLGQWILHGKSVWTDAAPRPAAQTARDGTLPSLAPVIRKVRDGVVGIRGVRRGSERDGRPDVINGTGFVIHASGLAVTNHHLVAHADRILVEVSGSKAVRAELVGADPVTDIAVVRFAAPHKLTVLKLGDSTEIEQGDWVVAIGNPYRYPRTVTVGNVSYVGRHLSDAGVAVSNEYLQFSAAVNPGNSGGPVLDLDGHVVGVTTSTLAESNNHLVRGTQQGVEVGARQDGPVGRPGAARLLGRAPAVARPRQPATPGHPGRGADRVRREGAARRPRGAAAARPWWWATTAGRCRTPTPCSIGSPTRSPATKPCWTCSATGDGCRR